MTELCVVLDSSIEHRAEFNGLPKVIAVATVVLPREYSDAVIDAGRFRELVPGLVFQCVTPRPNQKEEGAK